jgi:hypothetical protein
MFALRRATLGVSVLCATVANAQPAIVVGIVVDSIRMRPLAGATVLITAITQVFDAYASRNAAGDAKPFARDAPKQGMTDSRSHGRSLLYGRDLVERARRHELITIFGRR